MNPPEAAHVASTAPPAARFGSHMGFQTQAATRFALGGIERGEKVLIIGSRWQYLDILRGVQDLTQGSGLARIQSSWRNRDLTVFEADELQSELLVDNIPDGLRFASFIERLSKSGTGTRGVRVWNNLGARLQEAGKRRASAAIERLWHQARTLLGFTILCSYPIPEDVPRTNPTDVTASLACHTHLVRPSRESVTVERLHSGARDATLDST